MKNKLGFLDFTNTKERCKEEIPFNVDYIIRELLNFGNHKKDESKSRTEKMTNSDIMNDIENVQNENNIIGDHDDNSMKNDHSLGDFKANTDCSKNQRRMVSYQKLQDLIYLFGISRLYIIYRYNIYHTFSS